MPGRVGRARRVVRVLAYAWAGPTTCVGLLLGSFAILSGGRAQHRCGALEFHGGLVRWLLERTPIAAGAMTLGHVILGRDARCLSRLRPHELVHVRQAERWGPLFLPAYVAASLWSLVRFGSAYQSNWFERDARAREAQFAWATDDEPDLEAGRRSLA